MSTGAAAAELVNSRVERGTVAEVEVVRLFGPELDDD